MKTRLTSTSYVVLGLIDRLQPATAYDLKLAAAAGVANFWALPHTQLYSECGRLAGAELLEEEREQTGRRRRIYRLTGAGKQALDDWREDPSASTWELRDAGLLKLFFGADPRKLAETQLDAHRERLQTWQQIRDLDAELPEGMRLALLAGIGHELEYIRFWSRVHDGKL